MGRAPKSQRRRFGKGELLMPAPPEPAQSIRGCLDRLNQQWRQDGSMAALWQDWPKLAGPSLAEHCRPLTLRQGVLSVGASHPQWRQALLYSKLQLLAAIRGAGHLAPLYRPAAAYTMMKIVCFASTRPVAYALPKRFST